MSDATKGAIFLALMIPVAVRYFIKTGNNDLRLNWIDYSICAGIVATIVAINA